MSYLNQPLAYFSSIPARICALLSLTASLLSTSCIGPVVEVIKVDPLIAEKLRTEIPVYGQSQLTNVHYKDVLPLQATSCKNMLWDPPATEQDATDQLRFKAHRLRANGIMNLICFSGVGIDKNCWGSVTCNASAIQVSP